MCWGGKGHISVDVCVWGGEGYISVDVWGG